MEWVIEPPEVIIVAPGIGYGLPIDLNARDIRLPKESSGLEGFRDSVAKIRERVVAETAAWPSLKPA